MNRTQRIILAIMGPVILALFVVLAGLTVPVGTACIFSQSDLTPAQLPETRPTLENTIIDVYPDAWKSLSPQEKRAFADAFFVRHVTPQSGWRGEKPEKQLEILGGYYQKYQIAAKPDLKTLSIDESRECYGEVPATVLDEAADFLEFQRSGLLWLILCLAVTGFELWIFRTKKDEEPPP